MIFALFPTCNARFTVRPYTAGCAAVELLAIATSVFALALDARCDIALDALSFIEVTADTTAVPLCDKTLLEYLEDIDVDDDCCPLLVDLENFFGSDE